MILSSQWRHKVHVHVINADPKTWIPKMNEIRWNTRYFYVFMQKTFKNSLRPHKFETCQTT